MAEIAEIETLDEPGHGLKRTLKDLFAGAAGGVAQVLAGQPFDIVKVRLQTTQEYTGALDCATKIWKNEGPLAFYKGTLTPLIGIGACVSVQFGGFHYARRAFESRNATTNNNSKSNSTSLSSSTDLTYTQYFLSGAFAGLANTFLSSPIEHVRIRLQTQPHDPALRLYNGPASCVRTLIRDAGLAHGLYHGTGVTAFREASAYGTWFLVFEALMHREVSSRAVAHDAALEAGARFAIAEGKSSSSSSSSLTPKKLPSDHRKEISTGKVALYGGIAGEALWLASYPFDVVKSKLQSDGFAAGAWRYSGAIDCARKTLAAEGIGGFWKGIGPTLLRAMPVSAGTFAVVEMTMRLLN